MALTLTHYGSQYTQVTAGGFDPLEPGEWGGRVRYFQGYFKNTTGSTIAANSIIGMFRQLPAGLILPNSFIAWTAMGTSRTIDVGFQNHIKNSDLSAVTEDEDGLIAALDVAAAGTSSTAFYTLNKRGYTLAGPADITLKIEGGTMPANGEFFIHLFVVVD